MAFSNRICSFSGDFILLKSQLWKKTVPENQKEKSAILNIESVCDH